MRNRRKLDQRYAEMSEKNSHPVLNVKNAHESPPR